MTKETAEFLLNLINSLTLKVGDQGFAEMVAKISEAKRELEQEVVKVTE